MAEVPGNGVVQVKVGVWLPPSVKLLHAKEDGKLGSTLQPELVNSPELADTVLPFTLIVMPTPIELGLLTPSFTF